jgi:hypothetical protein
VPKVNESLTLVWRTNHQENCSSSYRTFESFKPWSSINGLINKA